MRTSASIGASLIGVIVLALGPCASAHTVHVSNVEELYSAVNNPTNAGATLQLSSGTYQLSANDPYGVPRLNGGRIELQPDMSLRGVFGNRSAVVINAYDLPATSFPQNGPIPGPNAAVRLGLGHNALEWLTVRDGRFAQANIDSGLQPLDAGTAFIRIAHVASSGSTRGLNVLNFGPLTSGQTIEVDIIDSHFFDNDLNLSEGIRIGNFQAVGSTVNANVLGNRAWGQKQGLLVVNNRATTSTVNVLSVANWFYDNGGGTIVIGGLSSNNTRTDGNTINFEALADWFIFNIGETEFDHGGLVVLGTENISTSGGGGSGNIVSVTLTGARLYGNEFADLVAIGARSVPPQTAALSQNNLVTIDIRGGGGLGKILPLVEYFADVLPEGEEYGNQVLVTRH
jgi:hypothetical protein